MRCFFTPWTLCAAAGLALLSIPGFARAKTILTDFGQSGYETVSDSGGRRWNNVTQNVVAGTVVGLIDTAGLSTGATLEITSAFNLGDYNTSGDTSARSPYDPSATRDSLFGNVGMFGSAANVVPVLTLSGLDPTKTCDLTFFASRSESDNRIAKYTVQGATTRTVFLDANGPAPHTVMLAGAIPSSDGTLRITIAHSTVAESGLPHRGNGDNATGFAYLGVLELTLAETAGVSPRPLVIMPLGSSITAGQSAQSPYNGGGYRTPLYEALAADGRFAPAYVGSSTTLMANSPTATNTLTTVGQRRHEGHPGYTTSQTLGNLNANDGSGGNNGGFWLRPGNGFEPDFITLNIGGNDFVQNRNDTAAIGRLATLVGELAALRPTATIVVSSIVYRPDIGAYVDLHYNPFIEDLVFRQILAGRRVRYLDLRTILGTGYLSSDNIHPTQTGYDLMGAAWYQTIVNGAAYWLGEVDSNWSTPPVGEDANWATDASLLSVRSGPPTAKTDVHFTTSAGHLDPGANLSVRSLNFGPGATAPVTLAAGRTLTLGRGGVTVQAGSGSHEIHSDLIVGAAQTWASAGPSLTVAGRVGGDSALTISGSGVLVLSGANTHTGTVTVLGGTLQVDGSTSAASHITVANGGRLAGAGAILGAVLCQAGGVLSPGPGAALLRSGPQTWGAGAVYEWDIIDADGIAGAGYDTLEADGAIDLSGLGSDTPARLVLRGALGPDDFHADRSYLWTLAHAPAGISGFKAGGFVVDAADFLPSLAGGAFSVSADSSRIYLRFTPADSLVRAWRLHHFGSGDNAGSGENASDPDGDGLCNLLEYALGGDPMNPASAPKPTVVYQSEAGSRRLSLDFVPRGDPALLYEVLAAGAPDGAWTTIWTGSDLPPNQVLRVSDTQTLAAGSRFLRLRISLR